MKECVCSSVCQFVMYQTCTQQSAAVPAADTQSGAGNKPPPRQLKSGAGAAACNGSAAYSGLYESFSETVLLNTGFSGVESLSLT